MVVANNLAGSLVELETENALRSGGKPTLREQFLKHKIIPVKI